MALDTFISYSAKDKTAADAACAVLERAGIRCWIAPRDIRPGQEYGHAIIEAIDQCRVMVLIFSANANDSRQIHREIERAVSKGVSIIPLRIEEVIPTRSMEYFLGAIHWLDALTPPLEKHLQRLAEVVKALLQIDVAAAPLRDNSSQASTTVRHAEPVRQGGGGAAWLTGAGRLLILVVGVAAACIALVIGGVWYYLMREPAAVTASVREPAPVTASDPQVLGYREFREPAAATALAREPAPVTASEPQILGSREFRERAAATAPAREPAQVTASEPQVLGYREFREAAAATAPAQGLVASLSQTVQSGVKTEVTQHVGFDRSCVPQRVVVKVTSPPANGTATSTEENKTLPAKTSLGGVQPCAGNSAPTAVVYYQSKPDFRGTDQFRYQRTNQDNPNDRLNGEILVTVTVK